MSDTPKRMTDSPEWQDQRERVDRNERRLMWFISLISPFIAIGVATMVNLYFRVERMDKFGTDWGRTDKSQQISEIRQSEMERVRLLQSIDKRLNNIEAKVGLPIGGNGL